MNLRSSLLDEKEARELVEKILGLDASIMSAAILSNTGVRLSHGYREDYRSKFSSNENDWSGPAFRGAMELASTKVDDKFLSQTESLVIIRKNLKQILTFIQPMAIIVAVLVDRSASGTVISDKIRGMFGLD